MYVSMYMYTIQKQFHVHGRGVSSYDYYLSVHGWFDRFFLTQNGP